MRNQFELQLQSLKKLVTDMSGLCRSSITKAAAIVLEDGDSDALHSQILSMDDEIGRMEREIEDLCMRLLLLQQPVAGDLRNVSACLRMVSDLERIGDQAGDIAELAPYVRESDAAHKTHLRQMTAIAIQMVKTATSAFLSGDILLAREAIAQDDQADALFDRIKQELIFLIGRDGNRGEQYLDLFLIAKYLERVGDHAVNIARWAIYSVTGQHEPSCS